MQYNNKNDGWQGHLFCQNKISEKLARILPRRVSGAVFLVIIYFMSFKGVVRIPYMSIIINNAVLIAPPIIKAVKFEFPSKEKNVTNGEIRYEHRHCPRFCPHVTTDIAIPV